MCYCVDPRLKPLRFACASCDHVDEVNSLWPQPSCFEGGFHVTPCINTIYMDSMVITGYRGSPRPSKPAFEGPRSHTRVYAGYDQTNEGNQCGKAPTSGT